MGVVYEALQLSLNRRVALKVLPFAAVADPRQLQRFRVEAQAAAQLHHTNIVPSTPWAANVACTITPCSMSKERRWPTSLAGCASSTSPGLPLRQSRRAG
jgi:serine/threonine protein kinase